MHAYPATRAPKPAYPATRAHAIAWHALRCAMSEEGYYFSIQELQVLLAAQNIRVEPFEFDVTGDLALQKILPSWLADLPLQETVRVVRDGRGDVEGLHGGHFSRLWSEDAWATLRQGENLDEDVGRDGDDR